VSLFWEPAPGAPFRILHRASFRSGGRLIYVVGPSGAGKDSVLGWVKKQLVGGAPVTFARRTITRLDDAGGEDHLAATPEAFEAAHARGEFALDWTANGQRYGIGQEIRVWLAQGLTVVVNGSRQYLPEARRHFPDLELVHITARPEVLRERLVRRGRESRSSIEKRLSRPDLDATRPVAEFVNEGELDVAGRQLLSFLRS
jgi:ribose 1,5-bisphosphokinase